MIALAVVLAAAGADGGVPAPPPANHVCANAPYGNHNHCDPFVWLLFSAGFQLHPQGAGVETSAVLDLEVQLRRKGHAYEGWGPALDLGVRHQAGWLFEPGAGVSWNPNAFLEITGSIGPSIGVDGTGLAGRAKLTVWFIHFVGVDLVAHVTPHGAVPMIGLRIDPSFPLLLWLTPPKFSTAWWFDDSPEKKQ
ncbi:MAG: hypothetical protein QM723_34870 [Myxococcaceae bacterium]